MEFEIYDKEKYRQELIKYYSNILDGRFLNLNPYDLSDEELMDSIPEGVPEGTSIWDINNSFCWLYIGESVQDAYNGNNYTYVNFYSDRNREKVAMSLNYSQLKYPLSVRTDSITPTYSEIGQMIQSELDDDVLNPEAFLRQTGLGIEYCICSIFLELQNTERRKTVLTLPIEMCHQNTYGSTFVFPRSLISHG